MNELVQNCASFGVFLSLGTYLLGMAINRRFKHPFTNPLLLTVLMLIPTLLLLKIDYEVFILDKISITSHYTNFVSGILNPADVVFFLSIIALFLFLTGRVFDKKRWA